MCTQFNNQNDLAESATTIDKQISILESRGMEIENKLKAKEYLLDIGYFRLGFYWFPFEKTYPRKIKRDHTFKDGTRLDYAIKLYYFDFDVRNIFLRYISRIEINLRTTIIYFISNAYNDNPFWYVDSKVICAETIESAEYKKALSDLSKEPLLRLDKKQHGKRPYAPAWKALEFMSFGTIIKLYESINSPRLQCDISAVYGMSHPSHFSNYINTIRKLRNYCAHGKVLFDLHLDEAIGNGPLGNLGNRKTMLSGMYLVLRYYLGIISDNRVKDMDKELLGAFERISYPEVSKIIFDNTGFRLEKIKKAAK